MEQTKTILKKTWVVAALACVCCLLWGSAIPLIKTGYRLMQMDSADTASQIVFAGVRFALAGILVLIFASLRERKVLLPDRTVLKYAVPVCMAQTVCQYFFFYIGVAHTSGVKGRNRPPGKYIFRPGILHLIKRNTDMRSQNPFR